jgi:hypothetical protein
MNVMRSRRVGRHCEGCDGRGELPTRFCQNEPNFSGRGMVVQSLCRERLVEDELAYLEYSSKPNCITMLYYNYTVIYWYSLKGIYYTPARSRKFVERGELADGETS